MWRQSIEFRWNAVFDPSIELTLGEAETWEDSLSHATRVIFAAW